MLHFAQLIGPIKSKFAKLSPAPAIPDISITIYYVQPPGGSTGTIKGGLAKPSSCAGLELTQNHHVPSKQ